MKTFATVYPDATGRAPGSPRMGYRRKKFARTLIQLPTLKILTQLQSSKPRNQLMTPNNLTLKIVSQMCSKHSIKSGRFVIFFFLFRVDWYCIGIKACASSFIMFYITFLAFWCFVWSLFYHWKKILQYYCNIACQFHMGSWGLCKSEQKCFYLLGTDYISEQFFQGPRTWTNCSKGKSDLVK